MLVFTDNNFKMSHSPHSLGLARNMTIPMPGWDANVNLQREKNWLGAGMGVLHNEPNRPQPTHPGEGFGGLIDDPMGWLAEDSGFGVSNGVLAIGAAILAWWLMAPHGE